MLKFLFKPFLSSYDLISIFIVGFVSSLLFDIKAHPVLWTITIAVLTLVSVAFSTHMERKYK